MRHFVSRAFVLFALALLPCSSSAIGLLVVDDHLPVHPPEFRPPPPRIWPHRPIHAFTPLEIRSVKVTTRITDQVAHTRVQQEFYNANARRLEGTFLLPLPKGAHLRQFALEIDGKMAEAELLDAEKAKEIYEDIIRKAKDPALLEYIGRDLLKVRIFPIEPNSTKRIEVAYDHLLKQDNGMVEYSLPLSTVQHSSTPIGTLEVQVELNSATSLKSIYSPGHSIDVRRHSDKSAQLAFEQKGAKPDRDFQLFYSAEATEVGLSLLTYRKSSSEPGYFMLLAAPGFGKRESRVLPKDVVFVLDTSGSMSGKKLDQAKKALLFCINNLNDRDRFEVVRFSTEAESLFNKLSEVTTTSRQEAETFVQELKSIGGTAIQDALLRALRLRPATADPPFQIVFLTDGQPTVGETNADAIVDRVTDKQPDSTRIFGFGIGTDVNTRLLDRIAEETSAVSQYVLPDEDLELKVSSFYSKISDPMLAGLQIDYGRIRASKIHPGKLPDLFKGQQLVVLGRYDGEGSAELTLTGKVGSKVEEFVLEGRFPEKSEVHTFIPRLWATRRVGYLLEEVRLRGENAELKGEITELARQYGIVTPYTSYLVQEDQPVPARPGAPSHSSGHDGLVMRRYSARPEAVAGDSAVASARYSGALKSALSEQERLEAGREIQLYAATGQLASRPASPGRSENLSRLVEGRSFSFKEHVWIESGLDGQPMQTMKFNSPEYWEFIRTHPHLLKILAIGPNVRFSVGERVYEIRD